MKAYLLLSIAVAFEILGTSSIQASQQFTRLVPTIGVIFGFGGAFWFLAQTLKYMPLGVVYAIWSGLGICLIALIGYLVFGQKPDLPAVLGMALIVAGIIVINVFSRTATH
jgi:small multidrug resistance pump